MSKTNKIFIFLFIFCLSTILKSYSQDAPMSQFYNNLVVLNPAFTGTTGNNRFNLYYRNQWLNTDAGFHSFGTSFDKTLRNKNSGIGIILSNEITGIYISPSIFGLYSYMFSVSKKWHISLGLKGGISQKYRNASELIFQNPEAISSSSKLTPDFSIGGVSFYKNTYAGISIDHITRPYQGVTKSSKEQLNRKLTLFVGFLKKYPSRLISQQRIISPNILIQIQGKQKNINWGTSFQYDYLIGGLWLRNSSHLDFDALIFSVGYKTSKHKFTYSYDMNLGKKTLVPLNSHEVSFSMTIESAHKKRYKSFKCPDFLQ